MTYMWSMYRSTLRVRHAALRGTILASIRLATADANPSDARDAATEAGKRAEKDDDDEEDEDEDGTGPLRSAATRNEQVTTSPSSEVPHRESRVAASAEAVSAAGVAVVAVSTVVTVVAAGAVVAAVAA